jgi:hypothetical protein
MRSSTFSIRAIAFSSSNFAIAASADAPGKVEILLLFRACLNIASGDDRGNFHLLMNKLFNYCQGHSVDLERTCAYEYPYS